MNRAEIRVIENQTEVVTNYEASSWEKQQLLAKYGYTQQQSEPEVQRGFDPTRDLSYQEMMELEDRRIQREYENRTHMENQPKPITIDYDRVNHSEMRWSSMDLGGQEFGIQVQIVSDMKIPGQRY
jgi:hypothetical protein